MSNAALNRARAMRQHPRGGAITGPQKSVLLLLADTSRDGIEAWPSVGTITADSGFAERTVRLALRGLEAGGTITARPVPGRQTVWTLNLPEVPPSLRQQGLNGHPRPAMEGGQQMPPPPAADAPPPRQEVPPTPAADAPKPYNPESYPKGEPRERAAPPPARTALPKDWQPSVEGEVHAGLLGLDLARTLRMFHSHHAMNGTRLADWDAAWALWCDREPAYAAKARSGGRRAAAADAMAEFERMAEAEAAAMRNGAPILGRGALHAPA